MPIRLQKILASAGVASRRAAERLIVEGRVTVNGATVRELGSHADPATDDIRVDGRPVRPVARVATSCSTSRAATSPRDPIPRGGPRCSTCCPACATTSTRSAAWTTTPKAC